MFHLKYVNQYIRGSYILFMKILDQSLIVKCDENASPAFYILKEKTKLSDVFASLPAGIINKSITGIVFGQLHIDAIRIFLKNQGGKNPYRSWSAGTLQWFTLKKTSINKYRHVMILWGYQSMIQLLLQDKYPIIVDQKYGIRNVYFFVHHKRYKKI